jgi:regulator of protease activity HflC (stomatin/prohibitin superfamily)
MVGFVFSIIVLVVAIIAFAIAVRAKKRASSLDAGTEKDDWNVGSVIARVVGVVAIIGALLLFWFSVSYTQDVGEANVLKSITGQVVGQETEAGLHLKAPWVDTVTFSIRNQQIVFGNDSDVSSNHTGGEVLGEQITTNDKNGVKEIVDIALRYSIDANSVDNIYRNYKSEDNFKSSFVEQDVRSAVRDAPNSFTTIKVLTDRVALQTAMQKEIEEHWKGTGVTIDSISIQSITPPKSVTEAYAQATQSQINITKAQNNLDATKVSAQAQVVQAKAKADANNLLSASLSPQVLEQNYINALKAGTVYVVPEGATPLISTAK